MDVKTCTKCGELKGFDAFHAHSGSPDGLQYACKICRRAAAKARNADHSEANRAKYAALPAEVKRARAAANYWNRREENLAAAKRYAREHREERITYLRDYYAANREKLIAASTEYKRRNPLRAKAWRDAWVCRHPERAREAHRAYKRRNPEKTLAQARRERRHLNSGYVRTLIRLHYGLTASEAPLGLVEHKRLLTERKRLLRARPVELRG